MRKTGSVGAQSWAAAHLKPALLSIRLCAHRNSRACRLAFCRLFLPEADREEEREELALDPPLPVVPVDLTWAHNFSSLFLPASAVLAEPVG